MLVEIIKPFPFSANGITEEQAVAGTQMEVPDSLVPGLTREGYVRETKALTGAPENKAGADEAARLEAEAKAKRQALVARAAELQITHDADIAEDALHTLINEATEKAKAEREALLARGVEMKITHDPEIPDEALKAMIADAEEKAKADDAEKARLEAEAKAKADAEAKAASAQGKAGKA